jgi:hypothetical protein
LNKYIFCGESDRFNYKRLVKDVIADFPEFIKSEINLAMLSTMQRTQHNALIYDQGREYTRILLSFFSITLMETSGLQEQLIIDGIIEKSFPTQLDSHQISGEGYGMMDSGSAIGLGFTAF